MTPSQVMIPGIDELTENGAILLQQAMVDANADQGNVTASDIALARSNIEALSFVQATGIHGAYRYLRDFVAKQAIPTTSEAEYLDEWLKAYDIPRKEAMPAERQATGTGLAGTVFKANSMLQNADGVTFIVAADAMINDDGALTVTGICDAAGAIGNLPKDAALTLTAMIDGIDADFTVIENGMVDGVETETDAAAIYRLRQRLANPPRGSAPSDYARWALQVPGITRAWGIRNPSGPTSAGVMIMADGNLPYGLPTEAQRQAVYAYIRDPERGPPDELFVIIPEPVFVDVTLRLTPDTPAIRGGIELELKDLFFREVEPAGRLPFTHLTEAISIAPGEYTHEMLQPNWINGGFLVAGVYQMLVLRNTRFVP